MKEVLIRDIMGGNSCKGQILSDGTVLYPKTDSVNHPSHYTSLPSRCKCGQPIECIDVTRYMNFNLGNAIKYAWRCDLKGKPIEDLKKAIFYLEDEIKRREEDGKS